MEVEILEDTVAASGMHDIRVLLDDGSCMFFQFLNVPSPQVLGNRITQMLANREFEDILRSDSWRNPVYWTKAEFAAQFRKLYQSARGTVVWRLAYWLIERINDGTFTDTQVRNAFNLTVNQYNNFKPRLQTNHSRYLEQYTAEGE